MSSAMIKLVCAVLCVVTWCDLSNGKALHQLSFHKLVAAPAKRISRSTGTYVADENGQRVIIITQETSKKSNSFNDNLSKKSNSFGSGSLSSNNNGFAGNNPRNNFPTNSNGNQIAQSSSSGDFIPNQSQGSLYQQNSFPSYNNPNLNQGYINQPSPIPGNNNPKYNQGYINQPNHFPGNYNPNYNQGYNYQPSSFPSNYYPNNGYNYQQGSYFGNQGYKHPQSSSHSQPSGFGVPFFNKPEFVLYPSPEEKRTQPNIVDPYGNSNNSSIPNNRVKFPGALKIIESLQGLGIPYLQTPDFDAPTTPRAFFPSTDIDIGKFKGQLAGSTSSFVNIDMLNTIIGGGHNQMMQQPDMPNKK